MDVDTTIGDDGDKERRGDMENGSTNTMNNTTITRVRESSTNRRVSAVRPKHKNRTVVSSEGEDVEDTMVVPVNSTVGDNGDEERRGALENGSTNAMHSTSMTRVRASGTNRRVSAVRLNNKNRTVVSSEVEDEEDTMVVPVNKFNTLKREYEKTKSLVRRLSGTVQLYEEKCARLLNEKTAIQLQFESAESALTSSASAPSRVNQREYRNGI